MSVIITGIDIQENCAFCPARETGISKSYCNNLLGKRIDIDLIDLDKTKPTWCPLKSVDGLIEKMKFFAKRQEEIALAINDENKRYAHIQVANAYHHCAQVIKEYCEVSE